MLNKLLIFCLLFSLAIVAQAIPTENPMFPFFKKGKKKQQTIEYQYLPDDILGTWWSPDKRGQLKFYKKDNKFFGKLVWSADDKPGQPKLDSENPTVSMRSNRIVGVDIFKNLTYNATEHTYENGTVYDARSGYTYSCSLWVEGKDILKVRGFMGFSLLGKTETFARVK